MAILTIYEVPHPILKQVAKPVTRVEERHTRLLDDMAETMFAAPGVGLAAPQVGVSERLIVAAIPIREGVSEPQEGDEDAGSKAWLTQLINPIIVAKEGSQVWDEGCLSVPELNVPVERFLEISVDALDKTGTPIRFVARGFYAVVLQHEFDHLDGVTLYERLSLLKRNLYLKKLKKVRGDGPASRSVPPLQGN